ncbi:MAG: hypothetical protein KQH53_08715 [Desulfarculaceae bacterium]|nr:hypothetical protein [Desulfarculaceae bacterium]
MPLPKLLAAALAALLLLAAGPEAGASPVPTWLRPDLSKSLWLPLDSYQADTSLSVPYKDTYVEVWQTTAKRQGAAFASFYEISKYDLTEKFLFYVFRLLNNGRVFQINMEIPGGTGVCLMDKEGKGDFQKVGSIYDDPQMPAWAVAMARGPKTFFPPPEMRSAKDQGIQMKDVFPSLKGRETKVHRYRLSNGSHIFLKMFPNRTVWGYDLKAVNKPPVSYWAPKWDRSYSRQDTPPQPDFKSYGVPTP